MKNINSKLPAFFKNLAFEALTAAFKQLYKVESHADLVLLQVL